MKKITLSLLFGFMSLIGFSQVGLVENFDAGFTLPAGWTSAAEDYAVSFVENCDGRSVRANLDDTNLDAQLTSPNIVGLSNGTDLTIAFDYKVVDWAAAIDATPAGWGDILVQYSTNDGAAWTTVDTIDDTNHVTSDTCGNWSVVVDAANMPMGSDFKLRIDANWTAGTYYIYLDNISATQVVVDPPECVNLITPSNGSTGVSINTDLEWSAAAGLPTGYTVTVGTSSGGTDIADNVNAGLSTTYDLPVLEYGTVYYVNITAFNANGDAINCTEYTFTTGSDPNAPVDCASGIPINTVYCYDNNETITWNFQSSNGSPLNVFFNAGEMEGCCDEVTIYEGTDNTGTVLYDDNNGGDMTGVSVISPSGFVFIEIDSDGSVSCVANNFTPLDFDVSCVDTSALPNCNASLLTPTNGTLDADINTALTWSPASILVTGYNISIGTTPGGTDIANNVDVGPATNYNPGTLLYETTYYVSIVPYNDNGSAINCNEESFTTENDPNQTVDCSINEEVNTVFCYENNDTMEFNFASSSGAPLVVVFNSGNTENNFDELVITDSDGTVIYNGYGAGGDLTGLVFTSTGSSIIVGVTSDGSVVSCTNNPWDFTVSCLDTTSLPNCNAALTAPANGAIDINENDDLNWTAATIFVTGYNLSIGTTPGGTDVLDNFDVGNVLTYEPGTLDFATTYYVTITPYNDNGLATGCIEESFTVRNDPNQILDCSMDESINTEYCYTNNDTMEFNFASNDGSPLAVFFNSGTTENNWDELVVTDSDGTVIYNGYGNGGDLTGLSFFSTGDSITVGVTSDGIIVSCGNDPWNFDVFCFDPLAPPNCNSVMTTPENGGIDVAIDTDITWTEASIIVTGYSISIGTTPGGTDIADNVDVGNVLTYDPGVLINATFYYVTIVPYNDNGPAIDCIEQSFKTVCIPQEVSFNAIGDCDTDPNNPDFVLEVNITDLSGSASIFVTDDQGSPMQTATEAGIITMGPYTANTVVTITTIKSDDDTCDVVSSPITFICPPPPNPCSIIYAGEDATVSCDDTSTDLEAVYHLFGQDTNTYIINGLDTCPLPSTVGGTGTSINTDDVWSDVLEIGFEFCFFGEVYDQILIGSNGVLSFEIENAGNFNDWGFTDSLPNNTDNALAQANIFGVAHDIDPSVCGDINYLVIGSAPYRQFVVNYTNVCHFSCNELMSSSQIILYESSNNIDVNVFDKPTCPGWNSGNAVIGVQNVPGTVAFTPPGRNTGPWSASDESWRFAPAAGVPNYTFEWFEGTTSLGNVENITVTPTETTTYTATATYELCTGGTATVSDEVIVTVDPSGFEDATFTMTPTCDGGTATITGTLGGTFAFNPVPTDGAIIDASTGTVTSGVSETTYTVEYTTPGPIACAATSTVDVTVLLADDAAFTMSPTCDGGTATVTGDAGGTFALNPVPTDGAMIDATTGEITGGDFETTYTVEYTTSGVCPITSSQMVTTLIADDASFTMMATCDGGTATITTGLIGGTFAFNPMPTDGAMIDAATGTITGGDFETTYTVEYTTTGACSSSSTQTVTTLAEDDASFTMTASCTGGTATITGDTGGTFTIVPIPTDGAVIDPITGEVTNGSMGETYIIEYTTSGACSNSTLQNLTLLTDVFDFIVTGDCNGAIYELTVEPVGNSYDPANATYILYDDMDSILLTNTVGDNIFVIDANIFTPPMSGSSYNYVVEVISDIGCVQTSPVTVDSINCIIPQGISPNNDGKNDNFDLTGYEVSRLEIFNRHGIKVYSKTNYTNDWYGQSDDGDELPVGTYFYVMEYQGNKTRTSWVYLNREN